MTSKNNRTPLLHHVKPCASFQIHRWSQNWVRVRKHLIWVKIGDFFVPRDLEIWWTTLKKQKSTSSILQKALCSISKPLVHSNWIYIPETPNSGQNWRFFVPGKLENWRMTFKINRAPFIYCLKLCASFHSHWCIQTGVTVQKRSICVKIGYFLSSVLISCLENTRNKVKISQWKSVLAVSISLTEFQLGMQTINVCRFSSTHIYVLSFLHEVWAQQCLSNYAIFTQSRTYDDSINSKFKKWVSRYMKIRPRTQLFEVDKTYI